MPSPRSPLLLAVLLVLLLVPVAPANAEVDEDEAAQTRAEIALGRDATRHFERRVKVASKGPQVERLRRILARLAPASGRALPYSVRIVEARDVNAITFPGGFIYVYRGLLDLKMDDCLLAGVLAHEVAHAARSHGYRKLLQMQALGALTGGQDGLVSGLGKMLFFGGVGRTYENQADKLAVRITAAAGYDPRGVLRALQALEKAGEQEPGLLATVVATHPPTADRIARVRAELTAMGK